MPNRRFPFFGIRSSPNGLLSGALLSAICVVLILTGFGLGVVSRRPDVSTDRRRFQVRGSSMHPTLHDGQVCELIERRDDDPLRRGDLLAIGQPSGIRVKRLAAVPGDTVDRIEGRLTINGKRFEDILKDRASGDFIAPALVEVVGQEPRWTRVNEWFLYTHHDQHRGGLPGPIMDDYPSNEDVSRQLHPVDRLVVRIDPARLEPTPPRVLFYRPMSESGLLVQPSDRASGTYLEEDSIELSAEDLSVTRELNPSRPIAVEDVGHLDPSEVQLFRQVEYRDDRPLLDYPIELGENEYFVLGDNTPISVDSRAHGPIAGEAILGRITIPSSPDLP